MHASETPESGIQKSNPQTTNSPRNSLGFTLGTFERLPDAYTQNVLKSLRELDNRKVDGFLRNWAIELSARVSELHNEARYAGLEQLETIAGKVPEEAFRVINCLTDKSNEKRPVKRQEAYLHTPKEHRDILRQCIRILSNPALRCLHLSQTLDSLAQIWLYRPRSEKYKEVREEATKAISEMASYNLHLWRNGWQYKIQQQVLNEAKGWNQEAPRKYFPLVIAVCKNLLKAEMEGQSWDRKTFTFSFAPVVANDNLIQLRQETLGLLQSMFEAATSAATKVQILETMNEATQCPSRGQYGDDVREMVLDNTKWIIEFYRSIVTKQSDTLVRHEIEQQTHWLKRWYADEISSISELLSEVQSDEFYSLYRILAGEALDLVDSQKDWATIQKERNEAIRDIAQEITDDNVVEWVGKLSKIAKISAESKSWGSGPLLQLLSQVGRSKPKIAENMSNRIVSEGNVLVDSIACLVQGIRKSDEANIADICVNEWLLSGNAKLILATPDTYRVGDEYLKPTDLDVFEELVSHSLPDNAQREELDRRIMECLPYVYRQDSGRSLELVHQLFTRADTKAISRYNHYLILAHRTGRMRIDEWSKEDFDVIVERLITVPAMDSDALHLLSIYAQNHPIALVDFFDTRVRKQKDQGSETGSRYRAIPYDLAEIAEVYGTHPRLDEVISRIITWFDRGDYHYEWAAGDLISRIQANDNSLKNSLLELIQGDSTQGIERAMEITNKLPQSPTTYEVCKEAVKHSQGNRELENHIEMAIQGRMHTWTGERGPIEIYEAKVKRMESWLDDENEYVQRFAQRIIDRLKTRIDHEEQKVAETETRRQRAT